VTVEGTVKCGDYIGPKGDGSGVGVVLKLGSSPVIGLALMNKDTHEVIYVCVCVCVCVCVLLIARDRRGPF
jgi:hypothetical protein